jgi:NAD-dependent dihydropyrimidine dehydrogenase PreA subunit
MFNSYVANSLRHDETVCNGCGMCISVCPHAVFDRSGGTVKVVRATACMECGACQLNCPVGAVSVKSGVGCAAAMISAALHGRAEVTCGPDCCGSSAPKIDSSRFRSLAPLALASSPTRRDASQIGACGCGESESDSREPSAGDSCCGGRG